MGVLMWEGYNCEIAIFFKNILIQNLNLMMQIEL